MSLDADSEADASEPIAFLTGATGFIGIHVARELIRHGWRLRCIARPNSTSSLEPLLALGAHVVEGDIFDPAVLTAGMRDVQLAVHLAALYDLGPVDTTRMQRTNVDGTRVFLEAVEAAGVPRAVHVSSTVVFGPLQGGSTEEGPPATLPARPPVMNPGEAPSVYHASKIAAHRLALDAIERGVPLTIAAPAFVYGPGDRGPVGRMLRDMLQGRLPAIPSRTAWFSFAYVEDVGRGIALSGLRGRVGETYVLGGEAASLEQFLVRAARAAGRRPPPLRFPPALLGALGGMMDGVTRVTGFRAGISREGIEAVTDGVWVHSSARALHDFDWSSRTLDEGLPATVDAAAVR